MAEPVKLTATQRSETGKGAARRIRATGRTPAVLYGRDVEATPITVDALDLFHALHTPARLNVLIRLQLDGDERLAMARNLQVHPVKEHILHVDLLTVSADQPIDVDVPISLLNEEQVSSESGGVVNLIEHTLPIRVSPMSVPNILELDIGGMEIGDVQRAGDIALPQGAELNLDPERTIVTINPPDIVEEPEVPTEEEELLEGELFEGEEAEGEPVEEEGGEGEGEPE